MTGPRVVITGMGAITPLGLTVKDLWTGLCAGACGISPIKAFGVGNFPVKLAGQVPDFKTHQYVPKSYRKAAKLMSRDIELAVVAAREALENAGLVTKGIDEQNVNVQPARMAVNLGAGLISCELPELGPAAAKSITDGKFDIRKWGKDGLDAVTPLWLLKYLPNMLACHVSIIHDIQGPSNTITCAEASAHIAIAEAANVIARGWADIALAGAGEAKVNPILLMRQWLLKRAVDENDIPPDQVCRPFDANAKGAVFGEAAGIVTLENLRHAAERNAKIYAELIGFGQSCSINPVYERLEPDGRAVHIAVEKALADAKITPDDLDLIIPHGTAIPADDLAEAKGIQTALGKAAEQIPCWPTKSMLSLTGAACGALDIIAAACAINDGRIPPAKNCEKKTPGCSLNINKHAIHRRLRHVLCCSYTYGGQTAALVLRKFDGAPND